MPEKNRVGHVEMISIGIGIAQFGTKAPLEKRKAFPWLIVLLKAPILAT
jgi:hypothetical protein